MSSTPSRPTQPSEVQERRVQSDRIDFSLVLAGIGEQLVRTPSPETDHVA